MNWFIMPGRPVEEKALATQQGDKGANDATRLPTTGERNTSLKRTVVNIGKVNFITIKFYFILFHSLFKFCKKFISFT